MTQPAISRHLKVLEGAGMIVRRVEGTKRPCRLAPTAVTEIDQWLAMLRKALSANYDRLDDVLAAYLQAFAGNLVSAGIRLGVIGQTDGQRILAALEPVVTEAARASFTRDPADFGSASFAVDLASMAHETQYSRLFRS